VNCFSTFGVARWAIIRNTNEEICQLEARTLSHKIHLPLGLTSPFVKCRAGQERQPGDSVQEGQLEGTGSNVPDEVRWEEGAGGTGQQGRHTDSYPKALHAVNTAERQDIP
jgi:hypothetical protein